MLRAVLGLRGPSGGALVGGRSLAASERACWPSLAPRGAAAVTSQRVRHSAAVSASALWLRSSSASCGTLHRRSYSATAEIATRPVPISASAVAERLPKASCAVLQATDEADGTETEYLLLGVEHGERLSIEHVRNAVRLFQPDTVVVEHCPFSLKSELPDATKMLPEYEAAVAVQEAALLPGTRVVLGDRFCLLTEWRIMAAMGFDPPEDAREHLAALEWPSDDVRTLVFDMEEEVFQSLRAGLDDEQAEAFDRALIHERDDVLANSLLAHPRLQGARRVLALIGEGHLRGVHERMQAGEVAMSDQLAPPPALYGPAARALFLEHGASPPDTTPEFRPERVAAWLAAEEAAAYAQLEGLQRDILRRVRERRLVPPATREAPSPALYLPPVAPRRPRVWFHPPSRSEPPAPPS